MGGNIEAEDLKWRSDTDFVDATVSFSTCLYTIQIFNENKAEVDSLFERLVSLTELNSLMTRLTGLADSRAAAHERSTELLLELEKKQQELEIRFKGLVKAAEKALALKTQHAGSVFSREPSGKVGGGSSSSTGENHSSNIGGQPVKLPYSAMSATSEAHQKPQAMASEPDKPKLKRKERGGQHRRSKFIRREAVARAIAWTVCI